MIADRGHMFIVGSMDTDTPPLDNSSTHFEGTGDENTRRDIELDSASDGEVTGIF